MRGPRYDSLGNTHLIALVTVPWEQADDAVTLIKERIPDGCDAHTVIGEFATTTDDVPVFDGLTQYLDFACRGRRMTSLRNRWRFRPPPTPYMMLITTVCMVLLVREVGW